MPECEHKKPSQLVRDHEHVCSGTHLDDDLHKCSDPTCRRWFA